MGYHAKWYRDHLQQKRELRIAVRNVRRLLRQSLRTRQRRTNDNRPETTQQTLPANATDPIKDAAQHTRGYASRARMHSHRCGSTSPNEKSERVGRGGARYTLRVPRRSCCMQHGLRWAAAALVACLEHVAERRERLVDRLRLGEPVARRVRLRRAHARIRPAVTAALSGSGRPLQPGMGEPVAHV